MVRAKRGRFFLLVALAVLMPGVFAYPDPASGHVERGIAFAHENKFREAAAEFVKALAIDPNLSEAHYLLGLVRQTWGKWDEARTSYEAALRLNPRYAEAQLGLAAVLARGADDEASLDKAAAACRKAIELNPAEAEPHFHLAGVERRKGNLSAAVAEYETTLRLEPRYPGAQLAFAAVLVEMREFERAAPILQAAAASSPQNPTVRHLLGVTRSKQGDAAGAVTELREAARLDPANAQTYYVLAMNLRKLGQGEEAARAIERFQELTAGKESVMQARYHLGQAQKLLAGGKLDEAIAEYQEALSFRQDPDVATDLAIALLRANRVEAAVDTLRDATRASPRHVLAQYHLGLAYARRRNYTEARTALLAALALRPEFPEALFNLGMTFAMENRLEEAEARLREAIRLRPDQAQSHYYLGVVLKERGNAAAAEAEFQAAQRLDPGFRPNAR
jgi:Flp pilus assembly protein TadD